jgi:serine/tyrosine/threonine adenylyltransferase
LFEEVVRRTAKMVALWQSVGYVHGVMNTDNMSILGLTIDYGPFGFMEYYNPRLVSNHSDSEARYCYENQPKTGKWNLLRLAEAFDPLLPLDWSQGYVDSHFDEQFSAVYLGTMARKLGFITSANPHKETLDTEEYELIQSFFKVLEETSADFTNTFRILSQISRDLKDTEGDHRVIDIIVNKFCAPVEHIISNKRPKYSPAGLMKIKHILETQPEVLALFGLDPETARKELAALDGMKELQKMNAQDVSAKNNELWAHWISQYKAALQKIDPAITDEVRKESMDAINPKFILRNYLLEEAIRAADGKEDFSKVEDLLKMSFNPYDEHSISEISTQPPPKWAYELCVSCSS